MSKENPKVNSFFVNLKKWREEMDGLRGLILSLNLEEDLKWNAPCYMLNGKNVVTLSIIKRSGENLINASEKINTAVKQINKERKYCKLAAMEFSSVVTWQSGFQCKTSLSKLRRENNWNK